MKVYALARLSLGTLFLVTGILGAVHAEIVSDSQKKTAMTELTKQVKEDAAKVKPSLKNDLKNDLIKDAENDLKQMRY